MALGIKREDAAKFSFLISVPAIAGAAVLELREGAVYFASHENEVLIGFFASALSGYLVLCGGVCALVGRGIEVDGCVLALACDIGACCRVLL